MEGGKIAFKPAEGSRYNDFVEGLRDTRRGPGGCDGDLGVSRLKRVVVERSGFCREAELGLCERSTGNPGEYGSVGVRNEEIF